MRPVSGCCPIISHAQGEWSPKFENDFTETEIRFPPVYVNLIGQVVSSPSNHVTAQLDPCHLIFGASPALDCLANVLKETIRLANGLAAWSPALADVFSNLKILKFQVFKTSEFGELC